MLLGDRRSNTRQHFFNILCSELTSVEKFLVKYDAISKALFYFVVGRTYDFREKRPDK